MNILLIHLPYYHGQQWSLPLGLAYIASSLSQAGFGVEVVDIDLLMKKGGYQPDKLLKRLREREYLFIGFGGVFFDFTFFRKLSFEIKKTAPETFQVIGGQWASRIPEVLLHNTAVDAVVLGEGEETVVRIANSLQSGKSVSELNYVCTNDKPLVKEYGLVQDLDSVPFPARDLFDLKHHRLERWAPDPLRYFATMVATRGCARKCVFCNPLGGKVLRTRSPENIIEEMIELHKKYNIKYFRFNDEVFLGSNKKIIDFCQVLKSSGLKITFSIWSWSENLNPEAVSLLRECGCNRIQIGIESGSPAILAEMNKVQDLSRVQQKIKIISDNGISCGSGFLTGTPGETKDTLQQTKNLILDLYDIKNFSISKINSIKFLVSSPIYELAKEQGFIKSDLDFIIECDRNMMFKFINLTKLNDKDYSDTLNKINNELKWKFYSKHKSRILKRLLLSDQIDYQRVLRAFTVSDLIPITKKLFYTLLDNLNNLKKLIFIRRKPESDVMGRPEAVSAPLQCLSPPKGLESS